MYKVMVIDDEGNLRQALEQLLVSNGYAFCGARDAESGLELLASEHPDLLLLDVMLPGTNGFDLCARIREQGRRIPVIFLSAKCDIVDKSIGFRAGGDDYVTKPFDSTELLLRIEAGLRRARVAESGASKRRSRAVVRLADMEIRLKKNEVLVHGQYVNLTPKEFQIIAFLANHVGEVFTAQSIIENVWGATYMPESASIAVFVRKIRNKIEDDPSKPRYLQTVWREGYRLGDESMLEPPEDEPAAG